MATPRLARDQIWTAVEALYRGERSYSSLVRRNRYYIVRIEPASKRLIIRYESGNSIAIDIEKVYAVYAELYRLGAMPRNYFNNQATCMRVLGMRQWHAPGAAMLALLPVVDTKVTFANGRLVVA